MTDRQERTAPHAPPRQPTRWLRVTSAAFALAIVLGGTELVTGVPSSGGRFVVIAALTVAFLAFALVGADILPSSSNQVAIAGVGVVTLGIALAVSWSASNSLPGPVRVVTTNNVSMCGDITSMDHDFVAITAQIDPGGQLKTTYVQELVPVASIKSITGVEHC